MLLPPKPSIVSQRRAAANPAAKTPITFTPPGGEWNFTLIDASWTIRSTEVTATDESAAETTEQALAELNGQYLKSANWTLDDHLVLTFDEGAIIEASPSEAD